MKKLSLAKAKKAFAGAVFVPLVAAFSAGYGVGKAIHRFLLK